MKFPHLPFSLIFFLASVVPVAVSLAQAQAPQHPLDALTSQEYWTVYDILHETGKIDADTSVPGVLLHEPNKDRVLAWKPGDPIFREADVMVLQKGLTIEARVDIAGHKMLYWKERPDVQAPQAEGEYRALNEAIKKNPEVIAALKKRGFTDLTVIRCGAEPYGYFALPILEGRRIMLGGCNNMHGVARGYGHAIEGLHIEIDAADMKILRVIDEGSAPETTSSTNFEDAPEHVRAGTKPIEVRQPLGPSFQVENGEVTWQNWRFRYRLDPRLGTILNQVKVEDAGRWRSVMYEGSISELFVPYMHPATGWATRVFIDAGEFFPGGIIATLREGMDCPATATYLSATFPDDRGIPVAHTREACLFEVATGQPAWRHMEKDEVWGRPSRVLILRTAMVIGNYDYIIDWRFERDGSIHVAVGATGIIEVKQVNETSAADMHMADAKAEYGQLVAEHTLGVNHDHFFSFRLDLDVDGVANSFQADRLVRQNLANHPARKSIWVMEPFTARTEKDAMMDIHLEHPTMWRFVNPGVKGPLGYPTGYEIMPGATAASLLDPEDGAQKVGAFSAHQLWVTPYHPDEFYASGVFPTAGKGNDGLPEWTKTNRGIENRDLVGWYTLGFHHVPRAEDWPVMPVMWHEFTIRPVNFFAHNPVLDLPMAP